MPSVALVTCTTLPEPDPDQAPLLEALRSAGARTELLAWDDPNGDPADYDLCVLRSCWNYYEAPRDFLRWAARAASVSELRNPLAVVRWNLHKRYLQSLDQAGVPIVPTAWFEHGEEVDLPMLLRHRGWREIVVKPSISASSFRTRRFAASELDQAGAFLAELLGDADAMVQPFFPSFASPGEAAVVWIDGAITHAVDKAPRFDGGEERVSAGRAVRAAEQELAASALACIDDPLLYARVDMVQNGSGQLCVSELELIEPSLFLLQCPAALHRLTAAIVARAQRRSTRVP